MDNLHHGAQPHRAPFAMGKQLGSQQQQCRTKPFAAPGAQMLANIGNRSDGRNGIAAKFALYGRQVVAQQIKDFFGRGCGL
jgi:hypothetical protein